LQKNFRAGRFENALRCALGIFSGISFIFANRENLRIFPIGLFTGGPVAENDIYNNLLQAFQNAEMKAATLGHDPFL